MGGARVNDAKRRERRERRGSARRARLRRRPLTTDADRLRPLLAFDTLVPDVHVYFPTQADDAVRGT